VAEMLAQAGFATGLDHDALAIAAKFATSLRQPSTDKPSTDKPPAKRQTP
jgi:hypothetical protein